MIGLIGRKIGMTQYFEDDGSHVPVTIIQAGPCPVLQVKSFRKDGYTAIQIGFGEKRQKLVNKPLKGHLKKSKQKSVRKIVEIRLGACENYKVGQIIDAGMFEAGDYVDIAGISIGKGFQGGVKRWHWAGGPKSHGSMMHRAPGSIGASSFPSRVFKGQHLPGRMGGKRITVQNLKIVKVDIEKGIIAVKGSVPGNENSFLLIKEAKKKPKQIEERMLQRLNPKDDGKDPKASKEIKDNTKQKEDPKDEKKD